MQGTLYRHLLAHIHIMYTSRKSKRESNYTIIPQLWKNKPCEVQVHISYFQSIVGWMRINELYKGFGWVKKSQKLFLVFFSQCITLGYLGWFVAVWFWVCIFRCGLALGFPLLNQLWWQELIQRCCLGPGVSGFLLVSTTTTHGHDMARVFVGGWSAAFFGEFLFIYQASDGWDLKVFFFQKHQAISLQKMCLYVSLLLAKGVTGCYGFTLPSRRIKMRL